VSPILADRVAAKAEDGITEIVSKILHVMRDLDEAWQKKPRKKRKSSKKENNAKDASIAEAAKFNSFILLTCDSALAAVAAKHGIQIQLLNC
jgi:predicted nuclease of predicted toxin-antitoxin system